MTLNLRTEEMENRRVALTVEVDQERVDQELRKAARKVGGQYRIPGFRRGKAPYNLIVQYVGLPNLYSEFLDELSNEIYPQAVEQAEIEPYAMASLDISSLEPLVYKFEVPLEPEIDLGDYRSLRVEKEPVEVTDEEVDERINSLRAQMADWAEVERPSEYGDMLTIDVKSVLQSEEGESASEEPSEETIVLDETDWDVTLDEDNPMEPEGLDQELLGMSPGEEKEFVLSWPEDSQSIYAGKSADFTVKVHSVEAMVEPELDDAFAIEVDEEFETLDDLINSIRESIQTEKAADAEQEYIERVLDTLIEQSEMDYPPVVIEDQIDSMINEFSRQLRMYGIESIDAYLAQMGMSLEEYRETLREQAEIAALRNLIISEVYQQEGITVSDDEIEERIDELTAEYVTEDATDEQKQMAEMITQNLRSGPGRNMLESQILQEKSLERLLAIAHGEEVPEPGAVEEQSETSEDVDDSAAEDSDANGTTSEEVAADEESVAEAQVELESQTETVSQTETESDAEADADDTASDDDAPDEEKQS